VRRVRVIPILLALAAASAPAKQPATRAADAKALLPCYIVLATDVSTSMNRGDPPIKDAAGKKRVLRDDAQVTFLKLLRHLHSDSYVGAVQFGSRILKCWPGEPGKAPRRGEAALLPWQKTDLDGEALRDRISSIRTYLLQGTRVDVAMGWAQDRVERARRRHGKGQGVLVLLTDGDPTNAGRELKAGAGGRVMTAAGQLARAGICVYPVLINRASYRPGRTPEALSGSDRDAERLMDRVAAATGGRAYRIKATRKLEDIFNDVLVRHVRPPGPPVPDPSRFPVSGHHRTVILIGPSLKSIEITPPAATGGAKRYTLGMAEGLDKASGVERRIMSLTTWDIAILSRPAAGPTWAGVWRPVPKTGAKYAGRVYLIPDFLLDVTATSPRPWWVHEQVAVRARLRAKPQQRQFGQAARTAPVLKGTDLAIRATVAPAEGGTPRPIPPGQWDAAGKTYTTGPLSLPKPGRVRVVCECQDHVGNLKIPLGRFAGEFEVSGAGATMRLLRADTGQVLVQVPSAATAPAVACKGGDRVRAELAPGRGLVAAALGGTLHLDNVTPKQWPFRRDASGRVVTDPMALPERDTHLAGHAEVRVTTPAGVRRLVLPAFDFHFDNPPRLERRFADRRNALWVGEYHDQTVSVSVLPVFADALERIRKSFPSELDQAVFQAVDTRGAQPKVTGLPVTCRRAAPPRVQGTGKAKTVTAVYRLASATPIPAANRCVIDLGAVLSGLAAAPARYAVVDPAAEGLFVWRVHQSRSPKPPAGVAGRIFRGEPITFSAEWKADQNVTAVAFEMGGAGPAKPAIVKLPIAARATAAQVRRSVPGLRDGATYSVIVHVTIAPAGPAKTVRLAGGQFLAADRPLELKRLAVGLTTGVDVPCWALEQVVLPVRASFTGYVPGRAAHSRRIEAFKKSCTLKVALPAAQAEDVSKTVRWTTAAPPTAEEGPRGEYRLEGHAVYTPMRTGRAVAELAGEYAARTHTAQAGLFVKDPRLALVVKELAGGGSENLLYDSNKLVAGAKAAFPISTSLGTQMRVEVRRLPGGAGPEAAAWRLGVRVLRRAAPDESAEAVFDKGGTLAAGAEPLAFDVQADRKGLYAVQLTSIDPTDEKPRVNLVTPTLVTIGEITPVPVAPPSGFLTERVRQWPFEYHVPVQPDWSVRPQALAFKFLLPGMDQAGPWLDGTTSLGGSGAARRLVARNPKFLPSLEGIGLTDGAVRFRLRHREVDRAKWTHPDVRVVPPWLQGVRFTYESGGASNETDAPAPEVHDPAYVIACPRFRAAPELAGWWTPREIKVYVWRNPTGDLARGEATAKALDELTQRHAVGGDDPDLRVFALPAGSGQAGSDFAWVAGVKVYQRPARRRFWGWPARGGQDEYVVLVSATYAEKRNPASAASGPGGGQRLIAEWFRPCTVTVHRPWRVPGVWIFLGAMALLAGGVQVVKRFVPSPGHLGLDVTVKGKAKVEPNRGSPVRAAVEETPLKREIAWCVQRLAQRWGPGVRSTGGAALPRYRRRVAAAFRALARAASAGVAGAIVVMRWAYWPQRRAWVVVRLNTPRGARGARTGTICVTTRLGAKGARIKATGNRPLQVPDAGKMATFVMRLGFKVGDRAFVIPVTCQVHRSARAANAGSAAGRRGQD